MKYIKTFEAKEKLSKKDIREINSEIKDLKRKIKETIESKEHYRKEIEAVEDKIKRCDKMIDLWTGDIDAYDKELASGYRED